MDSRANILKDVNANWLIIEKISAEPIDDEEIILAAVRQRGKTLQFASDRLKDNKEVVLTALDNSSAAFKYASEDLKRDRDVAYKALMGFTEEQFGIIAWDIALNPLIS